MKRVITASSGVPWSYYNNRFDAVDEKYLPPSGEGDTVATQIATAVNKLIYKWYNDGDVFDNTYYLDGWANDLSDYANWLHSNVPGAKSILEQINTATTEADYEHILKKLADTLLDSEFIDKYAEVPKVGSVYECSGPFEFVEGYDEDDDEGDWDEYEDEFYEEDEEWD